MSLEGNITVSVNVGIFEYNTSTSYAITTTGVAVKGDMLIHDGSDWVSLVAGGGGTVLTLDETTSKPSWKEQITWPS